MKKNDLREPLYREPREQSSRRFPMIVPALVSMAVLLAIVGAVWVAIVDDPDGGRSVAVATIQDPAPARTGSVESDRQQDDAAARSAPPAAPADAEVELAAFPVVPPALGADASLVEYTAVGPLPRVSPDGRRPLDVYARRSAPVPAGVPRVVVVVGGLGLSQTGTQDAIERLPEDVTLAFAPYGSSLQRWVGRARDEGHEVLLQVPLEPMDYPQTDPGEHTLLVSAGGGIRQDLHWVLSRMTGYAGVMNYMGARFTSDEQALAPFLGEIGERGLFYLDDGSSPRSVAGTVGEALRTPVVTADRIVDLTRSAGDIEAELMALEATARSRGLAVGVASAFPVSIETIARWAREAKSRGIVIVPASAALRS